MVRLAASCDQAARKVPNWSAGTECRKQIRWLTIPAAFSPLADRCNNSKQAVLSSPQGRFRSTAEKTAELGGSSNLWHSCPSSLRATSTGGGSGTGSASVKTKGLTITC